MGRWSQARRRGTAVPPPSSNSLSPPADEDWDLSATGADEAVGLLLSGTCPVGADGIRCSFSLGIDPDIGQMVSGNCSDALTSLPFSPSDTVNAWMRYLLGGIPVSDWSLQKQVIVP